MDEKLKKFIEVDLAYRINGLRMMELTIQYLEEFAFEAVPIEIVSKGKTLIKSNSRIITAPSIELGLIHSRCLLEFVGIKVSGYPDTRLSQRGGRENKGEILIEDFSNEDGKLSKVSIGDALNLYPGERKDAEYSLRLLICDASQAVAHLTPMRHENQIVFEYYKCGINGVLKILSEYFYKKLSIGMPESKISFREQG